MDSPRHRCDVAVIGTELAGLAAAALLARRGLRCLVWGHDSFGESCVVENVDIPRWPFLLSEFEARSAVRRVIEDLGLRQEIRRRLPFAQPVLQMIDSQHRLDLHEEDLPRRAELSREFGDEAPQLESSLRGGDERALAVTAWLDDLPQLGKRGFWAKRALAGGLRQAPLVDAALMPWHALDQAHPMAQWTRALVPFSCHVAWVDEAPLPTRRAVLRLLQGVRHARGGERSALAEMFCHYVETHGGQVHRTARVTALEFRRGEVSLRVDEQSIEWLSAAVIDASRSGVGDLLASPRLKKKIELDRAGQVVQGGVAALHRVYKPRALPRSLAAKVLVQTAERRPVMVHVDHAARPATGDTSQTDANAVVSVATLCQGSSTQRDQVFLGQVLDELLPFSDRYIIAELGGDDHFRPLYARSEGAAADPLGPRRLIQGPHPLLSRVGCDVLPAWGLEGEMRAAMLAVEAIAQRMQKNKKTEHAASAA